MDIVTCLLVLITVSSFFLAFLRKKNIDKTANGRKYPPGPPGLPLLGHIFSIKENDHKSYRKLMKYGHVCSIRFGPYPMIILNSYEAVQEAFVDKADSFSGRPQSSLMNQVTHGCGVVFIDGAIWKEHRRVMLRMMRQFGVGKKTMEEIVKDEFNQLREKINTNTPVDSRHLFEPVVSNVIGRLLFQERAGTDDPKFHLITDNLYAVGTTSPAIFLPGVSCLIKLPLIKYVFGNIEKFMNAWHVMHDFIRNKIDQRSRDLKQMGAIPNDIREANDVCDYLLIERKIQEAAKPGDHTFTDWQLIRTLLEIYGAGIDTTVTSFTWIALILSIFPDVQRKGQKEIEEKIGRDKLPSMEDRALLPYVSAVLDEIMRYSSIATSGLPHRSLEDTEVMGYFIPNNTIVQANFYGIHHNPEYWERPDDFYPEHFLTPDGQYQPSKYLIPFAIGKRSCAGEALARTQLFIGLTTILQSFSLSLAKGEHGIEQLLAGETGIAVKPKAHQVIFSRLS